MQDCTKCLKVQRLKNKIKNLELHFKEYEAITDKTYSKNLISPQKVINIILKVCNKRHKDLTKNSEIKQIIIWLLLRHCFKNVQSKEKKIALIIGSTRENVIYHLKKINDRMTVINNEYVIDRKFYNKVFQIDGIIENEKINNLKLK